MQWEISEQDIQRERIEMLGSKFMLGNGYMGYRGTLEEYGKHELCAVTLADCYDRHGDTWREPVNVPNPLHVDITVNGIALHALETPIRNHRQTLQLQNAIHCRETEYDIFGGVRVLSRRFLSRANEHLMALELCVEAMQTCNICITPSIDTELWDLNGPHLKGSIRHEGDAAIYEGYTLQSGQRICVAQVVSGAGSISLSAEERIVIKVYAVVYREKDMPGEYISAAVNAAVQARETGFAALLEAHSAVWQKLWEQTNVSIAGDEQADLALRYSLYILLANAPLHTSDTSIPARGLSGQVYKGAIFWDTELYILPFFRSTLPEIAKNLVQYRIKTLDGARRKARAYGYEGAFYAWESQDTGDDACTDYAFTDVFTGRPLRTFFRDKQIHISADVMYGILSYYEATGDAALLWQGGLETLLECSWFYYSRSRWSPLKKRFELCDVVGPDEYHERVDNDAYTNILVKEMIQKTLQLVDELRVLNGWQTDETLSVLGGTALLVSLWDFAENLYVPLPNADDVTEQFDGYFLHEDVTVEAVLSRRLRQDEYLGGANGPATQTQVIKQADVVLTNVLFPWCFSSRELLANYRYYSQRTEHGSTLSACIYALAAARCGDAQQAYEYYQITSRVDLDGSYKQRVGGIYIGGVHTASCGGAWMVAIQGLAGARWQDDTLEIDPCLPEKWDGIEFPLTLRGVKLCVQITRKWIIVSAESGVNPISVSHNEIRVVLKPGETIQIKQRGAIWEKHID